MWDKPSHDGKKQVRKSFKDFRGQIPGADPALCPQFGCHPDRRLDGVEPQYGEPVFKGPSGTNSPVL